MVNLSKLNVEFNVFKDIPFFQVCVEKRIRFGMEDLNVNLIRKIINDTFNGSCDISVIFVSEYIVNNKRFSSKSKISRFIEIKNWKETLVDDDDLGYKAVITTITNIEKQSVINYCSKILNGHDRAYISFYTDEFLIYVNCDVIDIISNNESEISKLKEKYVDLYDRYHEEDQ